MNLFFFILISCSLIGTVEVAKRIFSLPTTITRRVTHVGAALIAAISPFFLHKITIIVACLLFAGTLFVGRKTSFLSSIHDVDRKSLGDVFLPLGEALSAMLFLPHSVAAFQFGVLIMGISDALAGLVGEMYGKHRIAVLNSAKSLEGSLAFFLSTALIVFLYTHALGYPVLLIPLLLTLIEVCLVYGLDNLVLPLAGAVLFQIIFY